MLAMYPVCEVVQHVQGNMEWLLQGNMLVHWIALPSPMIIWCGLLEYLNFNNISRYDTII